MNFKNTFTISFSLVLFVVLYFLSSSLNAQAQARFFSYNNDFNSTKDELYSDSLQAVWHAKGSAFATEPHPIGDDNFFKVKKNGKLTYTCFSRSRECVDGYLGYKQASQAHMDFRYGFEYKVIESKKQSSFNIQIHTFQNYTTSRMVFCFSSDGNLLYSTDDIVTLKDLYNGKVKLMTEPCKSIKPIGEVNYIEVSRKARVWYVVVNKDTVKRINDERNFPQPSGWLSYTGPQITEVDNVSVELYPDQAEMEKMKIKNAAILADLLAMNGQYQMKAESCGQGSIQPFTVTVLFSEGVAANKCLVTGLTDTPLNLTVFVDPNKKASMDIFDDKYYKIGGEDYAISKMYFLNGLFYFRISRVVEQISGGIRQMGCNMVGTKK